MRDGQPGADSWGLAITEKRTGSSFDDRINVAWCYLSHLDDLLMMKGEEGGKPVEWP